MANNNERKTKIFHSEKEYNLIIKKENINNKILFNLAEESGEFNKNYYEKAYSLEELQKINPYFYMFDSIDDCENNLSNIFRDGDPRLVENSDSFDLKINLELPGGKRKELNFSLEKKAPDINKTISSLFEEVKKLKGKVNDLEMKLNQKDTIINTIQQYCTNLNNRHTIDFININSLISSLHKNSSNTLIVNPTELDFLNKKFNQIYPNKNIVYDLVFRKSRDSDKAIDFHKKCDNLRGTLILVRTFDNIKFGGYTIESWDGNNIIKKDSSAFIFYLNNLKAYNIKENQNAIFCDPNCGPYFMGNNNNCTFKIFDKFEENGGVCCKASDANYEGYLNDYEINNGISNFRVAELEVFKINVE